LALESRYERAVRSVVYVLGGDVGGKDTGAFWAGKSRNGMFAVYEERGDNMGAEGSSSLGV
jgi:hypothetical protein